MGTVLSTESARYAGLNGFDLMVIPYAVSLAGVKQTVKIYHEALLEAGHKVEDHKVQATFHLYAAATEAEAKAATGGRGVDVILDMGFVNTMAVGFNRIVLQGLVVV